MKLALESPYRLEPPRARGPNHYGRRVIEAGDLRRNAPLRALCERAKNAVALPCYADGERDRARLIDEEMRAAGLTLTPEARALLVPLLGGDRAASRNEIRKLTLYARGRDQVGVDDVTEQDRFDELRQRQRDIRQCQRYGEARLGGEQTKDAQMRAQERHR